MTTTHDRTPTVMLAGQAAIARALADSDELHVLARPAGARS